MVCEFEVIEYKREFISWHLRDTRFKMAQHFRYELVLCSQLNNYELVKTLFLKIFGGSTYMSKNSFQRMENSRP